MNQKDRVTKIEASLGINQTPETLEAMHRKLLNGGYKSGNLASTVVSILSNGGSGEHLRGGELPDILIDDMVRRLSKSKSKK
ncbi:MAG: hypothetical protein JW976_15645 [Syntrophaceae bacterium]|nr:hypothetical protein [Syntrophaceae bacterium]